MRTRIQFPLTELQQERFDAWVKRVWLDNYATSGEWYDDFDLSEVTCRLAERDVAEAVLRESTRHQFGWPYWATDGCREQYHFCSQPTLDQGWYHCMSCWTD